jgi:two-component system, cell cycle sensor histidine kinase and response regulator CckA
MDPTTILVIDDDATLRILLGLILRKEGYHVLEAADGAEALHLAAEHDISLVVCDVVMPGLSGPETVSRLHAVQPTATIFISGYDKSDISRYGTLSSDAVFMQKPVSGTGLVAEVRRLLE